MSFSTAEYRENIRGLTLDDLLNQLEIDLSKVGHANPDAALKMLLKMDQAYQSIDEMTRKENPVKAEAAQFKYVVDSLEKNSGSFLKDIGGKAQLLELRKKFSPQAERSWWFLDITHEQQMRARLRDLGLFLGTTGFLVVLFVIIYQNFLAPDPSVTKRYSLEMDADQALIEGDYAKALDSINQAVELNPQDPSMLNLRGVLYDRLGQQDKAMVEFGRAENILMNREQFLLSRASAWMKVGEFADALKDAQDTIRENPNSAEGYFYFGKVNELTQNYNQAIDAYTLASQLADQQGKVELNATIRVSMAMFMQNIPMFQPTKTISPTK